MAAEPAIPSYERGARRGSTTLVSLCLMTALGIAVGSYVSLTSRSAMASKRGLCQDEAQQLAQVGLEEALWALNQNTWTSSGPDGNTTWATSGADRTTTLTYPLSGNNGTGQVALTVANYASTGPTWPTLTSTATVTLPSGQSFTKSVRATTGTAPLFGNAIASADSYVSFVAGGTVDSWNSDPDNNTATPAVAYSFTSGNATNYAAVVAGRTNGTYGVILTQATVRGYVSTFGMPISYSTSGSPAASVVGPATAAGVNVDPTRLGKSAFVPIADVFTISPPATTGANYGGLINNLITLAASLLSPPAGITIYKTTSDLTVSALPLLAPNITVSNNMKLIVDGNVDIGGLLGLGKITITPTGSLELFVTGDVTIGGLGFDNQTHDPKKLAIYCSSASTSDALEYNTTQDFCGVIFCEQKPIDIKKNATFYGALLSRQYVRFSGAATAPVFHYDSALRKTRFTGVTTPYLITQVTDL